MIGVFIGTVIMQLGVNVWVEASSIMLSIKVFSAYKTVFVMGHFGFDDNRIHAICL